MKTAHDINDSFRKQIRNRQKQQLFRSIRSQYDKYFNSKQMVSQNNQIIEKQCLSYQENLKNLVQQIKKSDGIKMYNKIIDQSLHHQLIQNLKNNVNVQASLEVFSAIISKQKVKIAHKLVRLGLVQLVLKYSQNLEYVSMCMNILANIIFQNPEYSQMMLQNNVQRILFSLLRKIVLQKNNFDKNDQQNGFTVMWALAALLQTQNSINYKDQFLQILHFALEVHQKQLYTIGYTFRQQTQQLATNTINQIISTVSTQTKYLEHLLITIKLLSPINIKYSIISNLAMTAQPKQLQYCVRILSKIGSINPQTIPRNFEWWQRFYLKLIRVQDIQQFIIILRQSKIKQQFAYHILKDVLRRYSMSSLTLTNEVLICLNSQLQKSQNIQQRRKAKFLIKSTGVYQQLQKLYKSKNPDIHRKCEYLLTVINMMDVLPA